MDKTMNAALRWKRTYAGCYTATATCVLVDGDRRTERKVEFTVRHMPEWNGPEKWALTAETADNGEWAPIRLINLTDAIGFTCAEMKEAAAHSAAAGWRNYPGLGYCAA